MTRSTDLKKKIDALPLSPGVYIYKDKKGEILYVGKSVRLRDRVKSYFANPKTLLPKTRRLVTLIADLEYIETESEIEALLLEARLIKEHQPFYNFAGKDDKRSKLIKIENAGYRKRNGIKRTISKGLWPAVTTTRDPKDKDALYFGPFPDSRAVNDVLRAMRRIFPWCKYKNQTQFDRAKKACFYSHIKLCPGICTGTITLAEYWKLIDQLVLFLDGKRKTVQKNLQKEMILASKSEEFERAAYYRDMLKNIDYITQQFRSTSDYLQNPNLQDDIRAEEILQLQRMLTANPSKLHKVEPSDFYIEGYDISNLGKKYVVGSRVGFVGGEPVKALYRQYKIRSEKMPDDYAAMQEVIRRRLKNDTTRPHLMLIDGGKGQVNAVLEVQRELGDSTPVIGLAKRFETMILPVGGKTSSLNNSSAGDLRHAFEEILLPKDAPVRRLLQRVRDESHRFANRYRKKLQARRLKG